MSLRDPKARYAGFQTIVEGVDSGRAPAVLGPAQLAWAVNATTRGGFVTCRPGWAEMTLSFLDENGAVDTVAEARFRTGGRWQGAWSYIGTIDNQPVGYLMAMVGGRLFRIEVATGKVLDLSAQSGITTRADAPRSWFVQAESYLVVQNAGMDAALIYDGATLRQSAWPQTPEVPPGTAMEYNNGRLWIASPKGTEFVAGDLAYSVTGNAADVLGFTENQFLTGGGSFVVPSSAGRITALRSVAVTDSTTGQGPLQVMTTQGAFSINAPFDRDAWQTTTNPIQTVSMMSPGAVSDTAVVAVNGDLWFRAQDGVRSFQVARRDYGTWVNTPLSREVSRALDYDTPTLLSYASTVLFDNRLLVTTQPAQALNGSTLRGVKHAGLVALDFSPVSQMFNRTAPVWEGVWTGLQILQIVTVDLPVPRCFLFALNASSELEVWELSRSARFDGTGGRIAWSLETPSYGFDTGGWNLRELRYGDLWIDRMAGEISVNTRYREDGYPFWRDWCQFDDCADYEACSTGECEEPLQAQEQYRARRRLPAVTAVCDTVTGKPSNQLYRVQVRVDVTGHTRIKQLRLVANDIPEDVEGACCY